VSKIREIPPTTADRDLLKAINDRIREINMALGGGGVGNSAGAAAGLDASLNYGTRAQRLGKAPSNYGNASIFVETDRGLTYQIENRVWTYAGGIYKATFANAPTGLAAADTGLLWNVSDYAHLLRWTGSGWEFVDAMGGYVEWRVVAPDGNGWQLCDGSATKYLHIAAGAVSEVSYTTLNLAGNPAYLKMGNAYSGAINAAGVINANSASAGVTSGGASAALTGHSHTFSSDPVANAVGLPYFRK
jgi:hypothetical protein